MKIVITGSSGYLASYLAERFEQEAYADAVLRFGRTSQGQRHLDLVQPDRFDDSVLSGDEIIFFCAGISAPETCRTDYSLAWKVNVEGTSFFIEHALRRGCRVLFLSSDAVFGTAQGICTEESQTQADTPYGVMKKTVEDRFQTNRRFKSIRLSYVTSCNDRFVSYCLECLRKGKEAQIFHPFYRNCITLGDVGDTMTWFEHHFDEYQPAFLNLAGMELVSRVRIADELNRIYGNRLKYKIVFPGEDFFKSRAVITQMGSIYLQKYGILKNQTFTEKLKRELEGTML